MRTTVVFAIALCCLVVGIFSRCSNNPTNPTPPGQIQWSATSVVYDTTIDKKERSLIFFLASWCGWCKKLKTETLTNSQVISLVNASFNAVQIDPDADSLVVYRDTAVSCQTFTGTTYNVSGFPTVIALDWRGNEIGRLNGYRDATNFEQWLRQILALK